MKKFFGIIGSPVKHSLSPVLHNYWFEKYNIDVKNQQLKESLNGLVDNELFHTLKWNCGNCNVYNRKMFDTETWRTYLQEFNE